MLSGTDISSAYGGVDDGMDGFESNNLMGAPLEQPRSMRMPSIRSVMASQQATAPAPPTHAQQLPITVPAQAPAAVSTPLPQQPAPTVLEPPKPAGIAQQQQYYYPVQTADRVAWYPVQPRRPSYWDQLWSNKKDVGKLLILSLTVTVALAIHSFGKFYVKHLISTKDLTFSQETLLHAAYPLLLLFVVWNFKTVMQAK